MKQHPADDGGTPGSAARPAPAAQAQGVPAWRLSAGLLVAGVGLVLIGTVVAATPRYRG
jgi:hypothetical protein